MRVLLSELESLNLNADLEQLLEVAREHWLEDRGTAAELLLAKKACWRFIDSIGDGGLTSSEGRKARALLCVLEPMGDIEAQSMTAEWFDDMLDSLDDSGAALSQPGDRSDED
jgi:hypothetical protein